MKNNIFLIGFMGCGKTSLSKELAKSLNSFCFDTDSIIEQRENKSIKEIFDLNGENAFRKMEHDLFVFIKNNIKNAIIATGGGFGLIQNLKECGFVFYLKINFKDIISRLSGYEISKRPLLSNLEKAREIYEKRKEIYIENADFIIDVSNKNLKEISDIMVDILDKNKERN